MNIQELNKWSAEVCGIETEINDEYPELDDNIYWNNGSDIWNIEDPRCMQVFREKFEIDTCAENSNIGKWCCTIAPLSITDNNCHESYGKTIREAELACAWTLMGALK